ncbi:MAG: hypothetical protein MUC47_07195 [Candidatus Kapabacteria bacterium]|jgi:hypothetical protein|nr:hypothetical protein [Candidatus Kapabacteria bacterium]
MKYTFFGGALLVAVLTFLTGCEDGGSGPHPMHELDIITVSKDTALSGVSISWGAVITTSSDEIGMSTRYGQQRGSSVSTNPGYGRYSYFFNRNGGRDSSFNEYASIKVVEWPSSPGTIEVTPARIEQQEVKFDNGFVIESGSSTFYPVSGKIVVTKVLMGPSGPLYIEGYANGVLRERGSFGSQDLSGKTIILHAMKFRSGDPILRDAR